MIYLKCFQKNIDFCSVQDNRTKLKKVLQNMLTKQMVCGTIQKGG